MKKIAILFASFAYVGTCLAQNTFPWPASGNIGVGTMSPGATLEIRKELRSTQVGEFNWLKISGGGGCTGDLQQIAMGYDGTFSPLYFGAVTEDQTQQTTAGFFVATRSTSAGSVRPTEVFRISASGNVGIGTMSPASLLSLYSNTPQTAPLLVDRAFDGARIQFRYGGDATSAEMGMTWYGVGRVAVWNGANLNSTGATHTSHPLQAVNTEPSWLSFYDTANDIFDIRRIPAGGSATTFLRVTNSGNVGIGTTTPSHKLSVNGTVRAKEVVVDTNWSDYVFAKDYKLATLSEVEQHIAQKGHLPGVPSAAEVAEKGVSVGNMQAVLLAKIEELTLHQIAQEKRLNDQQSEIASLKAENAGLKR